MHHFARSVFPLGSCRRHLSVVILLLGWLSFSQTSAASARKNVLFLIADDLNTALGCYGHPLVQTPHLDRLAARGTRFDHAYCQFPLCGPSRNSFLTGRYPNQTGILSNAQIFRQTIPSTISLPQSFRLDGWFVGRIGKLYHFNVPNSIGTDGHDDPGSWELELNPAGCDRLEEMPNIFSLIPGQFGGTLSWYASPQSDERHTDGKQATEAAWVLERCARQKDRPFFLAVGFFRPHTPYVSPQGYFDRYPPASMPVVQGITEDQKDVPAAALASRKKEEEGMSDDLRRRAVQAYFASITFMDAQVGHVLESLDRLGLAQDTVIVFTSDHGYHLGEHGLWQKMSIFEESTRVPLIIAAPGVSSPGARVTTPVGLIDLYPTLTELGGVKAPADLPGQSLVPMLKDPTAPGRGWALSQVSRGSGTNGFMGYSLRTVRWRYTEWDEGRKGRELYDHDADPKELTNLAGLTAYASITTHLAGQLHQAMANSYPPDGVVPSLKHNLWAPNLTKP